MSARLNRIRDRIETMRTMLRNALDILEVRAIDRPIARLTLRPVPPSVTITSEAEIPTRFFKTPDPVLSKADLAAALKDRQQTLDDKLAELSGKIVSGEVPEADAPEIRERLIAAFPPIPGAELNNGSVTIQVKWS
jgi:hypothetical protein